MLRGLFSFHAFDAIFSLLILAGTVNFGYHALRGDYGVFSLVQVEAEEQALKAELAALRAERHQLEDLAVRLSESFLDLDLLDERARAVLGHIRADEITPR
jgi:cell division protein FtsB